MATALTRAVGTALAALLVAGCARTGAPPPTAWRNDPMLARVDAGGADASAPATTTSTTATGDTTVPTTASTTAASTPAAAGAATDDAATSGAATSGAASGRAGERSAPATTVAPFPTTTVPVGDEQAVVEFARLIDGLRAEQGAGRLTPDPDLAASAAAQVAAMIAAGDLFHQDLQDELGRGWSVAGENVGFGPGVAAIHTALVGSPGHFANLVNARFTHVGIAVRTDGNGRLWVAQVFGG